MRHKEHIERLMREALDSLVPDPAMQHRHEVRLVLDLVEERGAYQVLARLLQAFGHYRLDDCLPDQLTQIRHAVEGCFTAGHHTTYGFVQSVGRGTRIQE